MNESLHVKTQNIENRYKPRLLLAEAPTGNVQSDQVREIMDLFKKLNGTTIIQLAHPKTDAAYGNRIIDFKDGLQAEE